MKALVTESPGRIVYTDIPDPSLHDGRGAIVKITRCSLCGSDLHLYHAANGNEPFCIGHEALGEIVDVGTDVERFRRGERVLVMPSVGCGRCATCRRGDTIMCENARRSPVFGQGQPGLGGCQAEAVAVPAADINLVHLDESVSDAVALLLCDSMATAWYGARRAGIQLRETVAITGLGPIGQQVILAARAMGAGRIFGIDPVESRRAAGERLGAECLAPDVAVGVIKAATMGKGVDAVVDAAGGPATTGLCIRLARRGGRVSVIGVSEDAQVPFPVVEALVKNLEYYPGLCSVQAEMPALFAALASGRLDRSALEALVTHELPLSRGADGYAMSDRREPGVGKIVFDPSG